MGATTFVTIVKARKDYSAREAFEDMRSYELHKSGFGGYTGTIAEKHDFVMIPVAANVGPHRARKIASDMLDKGDPRIDDKFGPAGCIAVPGEYIFFGWAAE